MSSMALLLLIAYHQLLLFPVIPTCKTCSVSSNDDDDTKCDTCDVDNGYYPIYNRQSQCEDEAEEEFFSINTSLITFGFIQIKSQSALMEEET